MALPSSPPKRTHARKLGQDRPGRSAGSRQDHQLRHLPPESTLFVDLEAGDLSVKDWPGDTRATQDVDRVSRSGRLSRRSDGDRPADQAFSEAHPACLRELWRPGTTGEVRVPTVDSLTVLSRPVLAWCKTQPQAFSPKTGKPDNRVPMDCLGQEMIAAPRTCSMCATSM